jgi:hypothetical protein
MWLQQWFGAERDLAEQLLPWGACYACQTQTQTRVVEREAGIPNGREWFVCPEHQP